MQKYGPTKTKKIYIDRIVFPLGLNCPEKSCGNNELYHDVQETDELAEDVAEGIKFVEAFDRSLDYHLRCNVGFFVIVHVLVTQSLLEIAHRAVLPPSPNKPGHVKADCFKEEEEWRPLVEMAFKIWFGSVKVVPKSLDQFICTVIAPGILSQG